MAAERFRIILPTNFDCDNGLVKIPAPGQPLSEMLQFQICNLPKGMAQCRFHVVGRFDEEVRFHSQWPSIVDSLLTLKSVWPSGVSMWVSATVTAVAWRSSFGRSWTSTERLNACPQRQDAYLKLTLPFWPIVSLFVLTIVERIRGGWRRCGDS